MPIHVVTKVDKTKSGKDRVYFDGKTHWKDSFYLGKKASLPPVGATIDADTSSKTWEDGNTSWFLNDWRMMDEPAQSLSVDSRGQISGGIPPYTASLIVKASKGWNIDSGDLSRLASNLMASAIAAGLVKEPGQLMVWAAGAYRAAESLRSGKVEDFNDPMPFIEPGERPEDEEFDEKVPF